MNYKRFRRLYRLGNLQIARRRRRSRAKYVRGQAFAGRRIRTKSGRWTFFPIAYCMAECSARSRSSTSAADTDLPSIRDFSYPSVSVVRSS